MDKINWSYILIGTFFTFLAQGGVGYNIIYNLNMKTWVSTWWGWYVLSIPLTWLFLTNKIYS